jgi:hypothetical protein
MDPVAVLSLVFTAIAAIAAVAQLERIGWIPKVRLPFIGPGSRSLDPSLAAVSSLLRKIVPGTSTSNCEVRNIQTLDELKKLWRIDAAAYGDANLNYGHFQDMWHAYQKGLHAIFIDGEVAGALGVWPVTRKWIKEFSTGKVGEKDLSAETLKSAGERGTDYWYISGLVIKKEFRNGKAVPTLLKEATLGWAIDSKLKHPVNLSAIAISPDGEKLLARYGFTLATPGNHMIDGYSLYTRRVGRKELLQLIHLHDSSARAI